jgi:hypothetical protein
MKRIFSVFLACAVIQLAVAQENNEPVEQGPDGVGLTVGVAVTLSDVADKTTVGVHNEVVFEKTMGGLYLYGDVYDEVLFDDQMDTRVTYFEEEIGYRFGITQTAGIGIFANNTNIIYVAPEGPQNTSAIDGSVEPALKFDGAFSFGSIQAGLGIPVVYRQLWQAPDVEPVAGIHPEISWQSNIGLGIYGGVNFAFPPGSDKELVALDMPFERTEWKISYMTKMFYIELYIYTTIDFKKVNISPTITYFSGPLSVWFNLDMGKINYQSDFGICPTAWVTYSF